MTTGAGDQQAALAYLRRDVMGNLPMLKMLAAYPAQARLHFREREGGAAMLMLPVAASAFDRATYPTLEHWLGMGQ